MILHRIFAKFLRPQRYVIRISLGFTDHPYRHGNPDFGLHPSRFCDGYTIPLKWNTLVCRAERACPRVINPMRAGLGVNVAAAVGVGARPRGI